MICDFHLHTGMSYDSNSDINEVIETAAKKGMTHIAITDHHDFKIENGAFEQNPEHYFDVIKKYSDKYKDKINVSIGIELGMDASLSEQLNDFVNKRPFDFVIGSIHGVNGLDPYYEEYWEGLSTRQAMEKYFNAILDSIRSFDNFDVVGHIDYAIRYAKVSSERSYSYSEYAHILDPLLKTIIETNKGIEINTGGLRKGLTTSNPSEEIIKKYHEFGGKIITVGSDAHSPEDIGADFNAASQILKRCGFTEYCIFKNRKPEFLKIPL